MALLPSVAPRTSSDPAYTLITSESRDIHVCMRHTSLHLKAATLLLVLVQQAALGDKRSFGDGGLVTTGRCAACKLGTSCARAVPSTSGR